MSEADVRPVHDQPQLKGLSGWLVLVGIGICLSPIRMLFETYKIFAPVLQGDMANLFDPASPDYVAYAFAVISGEMLVNVLLLALSAAIIIGFFSKRAWFPKLYIFASMLTPLVLVFDALLVGAIFPGVEIFDKDTVREIGRSIVSAVIWVPYMLISKRVKNTFID